MATPGSYGKPTADTELTPEFGWWQVTAPSGEQGTLNPDKHQVTEHEDWTISVHPSIDFKEWPTHKWHGWLKKGVWTSV